MNIFILHQDPVLAARYQCDKHVVKMTLETAQLLCSAYEQGVAPYRRTHYNHPCAIWVRSSLSNYSWLVDHGLALAEEYTFRYSKVHKSKAIIEWCRDNMSLLKVPNVGLTPFALAMPDIHKCNDPVVSYRNYYKVDKQNIVSWKNREIPDWW